MAGSKRCRRARTGWEVSESEPEAEPEPRGPAKAPGGCTPASAAVRPKRRRATREAAEALRLLRPEHCLRLLEVCVDPGLLEDPTSDIWIQALSSLDCKCCFEPQAIPCSITWRRNTPSTPSPPDDCLVKTEEEKEELVLLEPEDFLKCLFSLTQSFVDAPSGSQPDLNQVLHQNLQPGCRWAGCLQPLPSSSRVDLQSPPRRGCVWRAELCQCASSAAVSGSFVSTSKADQEVADVGGCNLEQDGWQAPSPGKQSPRSQPGPELFMTQQEILEALVVLQLWANIDVQFLDTWQEFGEHVSALTKAITKRPHKRQQEMQELPFCTAGVSGRAVRVEKDGTGLWQVWKRQIQQFNRVSPATAAAIAAAYPSPGLLVRAYKECSTEGERLLLLRDIPVKSDLSGKNRRVGPDVSRHICLFVVATDPDLILARTARGGCEPRWSASMFRSAKLSSR